MKEEHYIVFLRYIAYSWPSRQKRI
jgi:hypothetical protein